MTGAYALFPGVRRIAGARDATNAANARNDCWTLSAKAAKYHAHWAINAATGRLMANGKAK